MEVGFAAAVRVPIFATQPPSDLTLRQYVNVVSSLSEAIRTISTSPDPRRSEGILINPSASIAEAHDILERVQAALTRSGASDDPAQRVNHDLAEFHSLLGLPTYVQ